MSIESLGAPSGTGSRACGLEPLRVSTLRAPIPSAKKLGGVTIYCRQTDDGEVVGCDREEWLPQEIDRQSKIAADAADRASELRRELLALNARGIVTPTGANPEGMSGEAIEPGAREGARPEAA